MIGDCLKSNNFHMWNYHNLTCEIINFISARILIKRSTLYNKDDLIKEDLPILI